MTRPYGKTKGKSGCNVDGPPSRRTGARTGAGSSMYTTPILNSSSEFSTSRPARATSKCLRSTGAKGHRKSSVSCGTRTLVVGLLLAATLEVWSSGCGRRAVRGGLGSTSPALGGAAPWDGGHLEVLQWMRAQDPPCPWDSDVCYGTLLCNGHLEVLRWARSQGCPWNEEAPCAAARNGHLKVLKWLIKEGMPLRRERERGTARGAGAGGRKL